MIQTIPTTSSSYLKGMCPKIASRLHFLSSKIYLLGMIYIFLPFEILTYLFFQQTPRKQSSMLQFIRSKSEKRLIPVDSVDSVASKKYRPDDSDYTDDIPATTRGHGDTSSVSPSLDVGGVQPSDSRKSCEGSLARPLESHAATTGTTKNRKSKKIDRTPVTSTDCRSEARSRRESTFSHITEGSLSQIIDSGPTQTDMQPTSRKSNSNCLSLGVSYSATPNRTPKPIAAVQPQRYDL